MEGLIFYLILLEVFLAICLSIMLIEYNELNRKIEEIYSMTYLTKMDVEELIRRSEEE